MDTGTGRFVDSIFAPKKANRYEVGQMVSLDGDDYQVTDIRNVDGRGEITLRGMSRLDHEKKLADYGRRLDEHRQRITGNRAERRIEERKRRLERKRVRQAR